LGSLGHVWRDTTLKDVRAEGLSRCRRSQTSVPKQWERRKKGIQGKSFSKSKKGVIQMPEPLSRGSEKKKIRSAEARPPHHKNIFKAVGRKGNKRWLKKTPIKL